MAKIGELVRDIVDKEIRRRCEVIDIAEKVREAKMRWQR
jgi:hypothetical protein